MIAPWDNIDRARKAKGLSLRNLARAVGVSDSAVQYWKNGKTISLDTMAKLALVLDTTVDALLGRPERPEPAVARETPPPYGNELDAVAIIAAMPNDALQGTFSAAVNIGNESLAAALGAEMARRKKEKQEPTDWEDKKK